MAKLKILFDHQAFQLQAYGGVSRYFYELLRNLYKDEKLECSVSLLHSLNCYTKHELFSDHNFLLSKMNFKGKYRITALLNKIKSIHALRIGNYDIFHPTYYDPYFLNHIGRKPFVLTIHDMIHELFPQEFPIGDRIALWKRNLAEKAASIIAVSNNTKMDVRRIYHIDEERIHVIYHGSSLIDKTYSRASDNQNKKRFVLFVGRRTGYKNFIQFVKAVAPILWSEDDLNVVCAGGGFFGPDEIHCFETLQVKQRISQCDVDDDTLAHLYKNASAFVFPSLYEGFGIPILESFRCGCPVICSNAGSLPEVAGDAAAYFDPNDLRSIEDAIKTVIRDEELRQKLRTKGFHRVKSFSWKRASEMTRTVYDRICHTAD